MTDYTDYIDDPRIPALQERIHKASGHDWQPACGQCFARAYQYVRTTDLLATPTAKGHRHQWCNHPQHNHCVKCDVLRYDHD